MVVLPPVTSAASMRTECFLRPLRRSGAPLHATKPVVRRQLVRLPCRVAAACTGAELTAISARRRRPARYRVNPAGDCRHVGERAQTSEHGDRRMQRNATFLEFLLSG